VAFDGGSITARLGLDRKGFDRGLRGAQGSAKRFDRTMGMLFKGGLMATGLGLATRQIFKFADSSARLVDMSNAFDRLAEREGIASEQIIGDVKAITNALSRRQVMETGNMLDLLGVGVQQLPKFTRIAQAAGVALNRTTADMLESLSVGTARQSKLWLDNLGILISIEEANAKYAKQLGITTGAMTDQQQRAAFLNAVLEKGEDIIRKVSGESELQAEKTASLSTAWQDAKDSLSEYLIESLKFGDLFAKIADGINQENELIRTNKDLREQAARAGLQETQYSSAFLNYVNRTKEITRVFEASIEGIRNKRLPVGVQRQLAATDPSLIPDRTTGPIPDQGNFSGKEIVRSWKEVKLSNDEIKRAHSDYAAAVGKLVSSLDREDRRIAEVTAKLTRVGAGGTPATGDVGGAGDPRQQMLEARKRRLEREAEATRAANKELQDFIRGVDSSGEHIKGLAQDVRDLGSAAHTVSPILRSTSPGFPEDLSGTGQPRDLRGVPVLDRADVGPTPPVIDSGAGTQPFQNLIDGADLALGAMDSLGDATAGFFEMLITDSGNAGRAFFSNLMAGFAGVASNLGDLFIQTGLGMLGLGAAGDFPNPFVTILAGIALKAIGGIARGIAFNNAPSTGQPRNTRQPLADPSKEPGASITVNGWRVLRG